MLIDKNQTEDLKTPIARSRLRRFTPFSKTAFRLYSAKYQWTFHFRMLSPAQAELVDIGMDKVSTKLMVLISTDFIATMPSKNNNGNREVDRLYQRLTQIFKPSIIKDIRSQNSPS